MYVVRIYGDDPQAGPGALLEEHEFASFSEARRFENEARQDAGVRVTLDGDLCYCMGGVGPHPYHGAPRPGIDY